MFIFQLLVAPFAFVFAFLPRGIFLSPFKRNEINFHFNQQKRKIFSCTPFSRSLPFPAPAPPSSLFFLSPFGHKFDGNFYNDLIKSLAFLFLLTGGYYTIEQTKSRLRIVVLNTNFMRHDFKYSQSHLSAVRQRPDGSVQGQQQYNMGYHRKHYHEHNDEHNEHNNNNYNRYNKDRYYGSHSNSDEARLNLQNGATENGAIVSALSVSHESEKQWEWFEEVLAKSHRNKETVSKYIMVIQALALLSNVKWTWMMIPRP